MLHSQQVIERSIYFAILNILLQKGLTLNPEDYMPLSEANSIRYKTDREAIEADKHLYIELYGSSDSLSKGLKFAPRIVISPQGFYPGDIGFEKSQLEDDNDSDNFLVTEMPFEAIDQNIDIILVSNNIEESRLLHSIVNSAIPQRGYVKPYTSVNKPFSGNIFILLANFYKADNNEHGLIEKVYQFTVKDTILEDIPFIDETVPINDIRLLLQDTEIHVQT